MKRAVIALLLVALLLSLATNAYGWVRVRRMRLGLLELGVIKCKSKGLQVEYFCAHSIRFPDGDHCYKIVAYCIAD